MKWLRALRKNKVDSPEKPSDPPERLFVVLLEGSIMDASRTARGASQKLAMLKGETEIEDNWLVEEYRLVQDTPVIH